MRPDELPIPTPCHEDWSLMAPRDRGRFCSACAVEVMDVSAFEAEQAVTVLRAGGPRCISYVVREDGSIRFRDSPDVPLTRLRRARAGALLAATLTLAAACGETTRTAGAPTAVGQVALPVEARTQGELPLAPTTGTSGGPEGTTPDAHPEPCDPDTGRPATPHGKRGRVEPPREHRIAGGMPAPLPPPDPPAADAGVAPPPPPDPTEPRLRGRLRDDGAR